MLFTRLGWPVAVIVGLYGVLDLVWIFAVQYEAVFQLDVTGAENWGRVFRETGLLKDVGVALQRIGFAVVLGVLAEISTSVAGNRSA